MVNFFVFSKTTIASVSFSAATRTNSLVTTIFLNSYTLTPNKIFFSCFSTRALKDNVTREILQTLIPKQLQCDLIARKIYMESSMPLPPGIKKGIYPTNNHMHVIRRLSHDEVLHGIKQAIIVVDGTLMVVEDGIPYQEYADDSDSEFFFEIWCKNKILHVVFQNHSDVPEKYRGKGYTMKEIQYSQDVSFYLKDFLVENVVEINKSIKVLEIKKPIFSSLHFYQIEIEFQFLRHEYFIKRDAVTGQVTKEMTRHEERQTTKQGWLVFTDAENDAVSHEVLMERQYNRDNGLIPGYMPVRSFFDFYGHIKNFLAKREERLFGKKRRLAQQRMSTEEIKQANQEEKLKRSLLSKLGLRGKRIYVPKLFHKLFAKLRKPGQRHFSTSSIIVDKKAVLTEKNKTPLALQKAATIAQVQKDVAQKPFLKRFPKKIIVKLTDRGWFTKKNGQAYYKIVPVRRGHCLLRSPEGLTIFYRTKNLKTIFDHNVNAYKRKVYQLDYWLKWCDQQIVWKDALAAVQKLDITALKAIIEKYKRPYLFLSSAGEARYIKLRSIIQPQYQYVSAELEKRKWLIKNTHTQFGLFSIQNYLKKQLAKLRKVCVEASGVTKLERALFKIQLLSIDLVSASSDRTLSTEELFFSLPLKNLHFIEWRKEVISQLAIAFDDYTLLLRKDKKKIFKNFHKKKLAKRKADSQANYKHNAIKLRMPKALLKQVSKYACKKQLWIKYARRVKNKKALLAFLKRKRLFSSKRKNRTSRFVFIKRAIGKKSWTRWGKTRVSILKTSKGKLRYRALKKFKKIHKVFPKKKTKHQLVAQILSLKMFFPIISRKSLYKQMLQRQLRRIYQMYNKKTKKRKTSRIIWPKTFSPLAKLEDHSPNTWWKRKKLNLRTLNRLKYKNISVGYQSLKRSNAYFNERQFGFQLSYFTLTYKLLYRRWNSWRTPEGNPIARKWPTKVEIRQREALNEQRAFKRLSILEKILKEKQAGRFQNVTALELMLLKKELRPLKFYDKVFKELETLTGAPASVGYRRRRSSYRRDSLYDRKPLATRRASPFLHPFALLPRPSKQFVNLPFRYIFVSRYKKLFLSKSSLLRRQKKLNYFFYMKEAGLVYKTYKVRNYTKYTVAAASRRSSFDRAVRTFYKKTVNSRCKKRNRLRFKNILFFSRSLRNEMHKSARMQQPKVPIGFAPKKNRLFFNCSTLRKIIPLTSQLADLSATRPIKCRTESTSLTASQKSSRSTLKTRSNSFKAKILLKISLNKRLNKRLFLDFKLALKKRRLPNEQALTPWAKRKLELSYANKKSINFSTTQPFSRGQKNYWSQRLFALSILNSAASPFRNTETTRITKIIAPLKKLRNILKYSTKRKVSVRAAKKIHTSKKTRIWLTKRQKKNSFSLKHSATTFRKSEEKFVFIGVQKLFFKKITNPQYFSNACLFSIGSKKYVNSLRSKKALFLMEQTLQLFKGLIKQVLNKNLKSLKAVKSVYWNLRIYLEQEAKAHAATEKNLVTSFLNNELYLSYNKSNSTRLKLEKLLYRYQPSRDTRKGNIKKQLLQWLRTFFPKKHSLYNEDSEEYKKVLLSAEQVFRSDQSQLSPGVWNTRNLGMPLEGRINRLLTTKEKTTRFETVLMTYSKKCSSIVQTKCRVSTPSECYFNRKYTTKTKQNEILYKKMRALNSEAYRDITSSFTHLFTARFKIQNKGLELYRASQVAKRSSIASTNVIVQTRLKSIRNRLYARRTNNLYTIKNVFKQTILVSTIRQNTKFDYSLSIAKKLKLRVSETVATSVRLLYVRKAKICLGQPKFKLAILASALQLKRAFRVKLRKIKRNKHWAAAAKKKIKTRKRKTSVFPQNYKVSAHYVSARALLSTELKILTIWLKQNKLKNKSDVFSCRRNQLWSDLTSKWTKKDRLLKYWLKRSKRRLKQNAWTLMTERSFKEMRNRLKILDWADQDDAFDRPDLRNAFRLYPNEKSKTPWLEGLIYKRATYNTNVGPYRKHAIPREQKRLKSLQTLRKQLLNPTSRQKYIKGKKLFRLNILNTKLYLSLFKLRTKKAAQNHFQKLNRNITSIPGYVKMGVGLKNRFDVTLLALRVAPTTFWSKIFAKLGFTSRNGRVVQNGNVRIKQGDTLHFDTNKVNYLKASFRAQKKRYENKKQQLIAFSPNYTYNYSIETAVYERHARAEDELQNGRITKLTFNLFREGLRLGR